MTPSEVGIFTIACLAALVAVMGYVTATVLPAIGKLRDGISDLKTGHALNAQQVAQNTARLNGQSQKIDTLMLATPPPGASSAAVNVNAGAPADVTINAPGGDKPAEDAAPTFVPPKLVPPAGMTEAEAIANNVSMQPAPPEGEATPAPGPPALASQEM